MKVKIKATEDQDILHNRISKRYDSAHLKDEFIVADIDPGNLGNIEMTPGIDYIKTKNKTIDGLKGTPVQEQAYARLESKKDLARAVLASIEGYDLKVLNTERRWDLRLLKRINPDIKHLKHDNPPQILDIGKTIDPSDTEREYVGPRLSTEEVDTVYSFIVPETHQ